MLFEVWLFTSEPTFSRAKVVAFTLKKCLQKNGKKRSVTYLLYIEAITATLVISFMTNKPFFSSL